MKAKVKMRVCSPQVGCGEEKPESEFYKLTRGGFQSVCKACYRKKRRERYKSDPQPEIERATKNYLDNRDKMMKAGREYYATHRKDLQDRARERYRALIKKAEGRSVKERVASEGTEVGKIARKASRAKKSRA